MAGFKKRMTDVRFEVGGASRRLTVRRGLFVFFALLQSLVLLYATDVRAPALYDLLSDIQLAQSTDVVLLLLLVSVMPALLLNLQLDRPSKLVVLAIYFSVFIPSVVIGPSISDRPLGDFVPYLMAVSASLAILAFPVSRFRGPIMRLSVSRNVYAISLSALSVAMLATCLARIDVDLVWRPFNEIYDVRDALVNTYTLSSDPLLAYFKQWLMTVAIPLLFAVGALWRIHWVTILSLILAYVSYQAFAEKAALASILAAGWVVGAIFLSKRRWADGTILIGLVMIMLGIVLALDYFFDDSLLLATWYMRSFVTPGLITSFYLDHFMLNPYAMFGDSTLGAVFGTQTSNENIPLVVGSIYVYPGAWANANFWADSFANLGVSAVVTASLVLRLIIGVLDALTVGRDVRIVLAASMPMVFALANTALQRVIVGNGFWLLLLLVVLLPLEQPESVAPHEKT